MTDRGEIRYADPSERPDHILEAIFRSLDSAEPVDNDYARIMRQVYETVVTFQALHQHMFEAYEDGLFSTAAKRARFAAQEAYAVGDLHAKLADIFEAAPDRDVAPEIRHASNRRVTRRGDADVLLLRELVS